MLHDCDCQSPRAAVSFTTRFTPAFYSKAAAQPQGFLRPGGEKLKSGPQRRQGEASLPSLWSRPSLLLLTCPAHLEKSLDEPPFTTAHSIQDNLETQTFISCLCFYLFTTFVCVCVFICFPVLVFKEKEFIVEVFIFPVSQCEMPSMS